MKKLRLIVAIAALLTVFEQKSAAQFYFYDRDHYDTHLLFEVGASVGAMNCLTDIGGNRGLGSTFVKDVNFGNNQLNGSIYLTALYKYAVGLRLEATFGKVRAYDSILKSVRETVNGRYERNLQFRSRITEVSLLAEFHINYILRSFLYEDDLNIDDNPPRYAPYILAGIGTYSFNPQSQIGNTWVDLQPLSTEGQGFEEYQGQSFLEYPYRKPYKLTGLNTSFGFGLKYEISNNLNLRGEFLYRILSTDYLDDVSTRYINPNLFQKYFTGKQLQNALDLSRNDRTNPGGPTGQFSKIEGGRRGDPTDNDAYFTFNIKLGFTLGRERIKHAGGGLKQVRCPTRF